MRYEIEFDPSAEKEFSKLDNSVQKAVQKYLNKEQLRHNPRAFGKALRYSLYGLWRYRVGNYRLIVDIQDDILIILVLEIDHRKDIYVK
jgi:mRNA interferase RelE/StbE